MPNTNTITMPQAVPAAVVPTPAAQPVPAAVVPTPAVAAAEVAPAGVTPSESLVGNTPKVYTASEQDAPVDPLPPVGNVVTKVALALIQVDTRMYGGDDVDIYIDGSYVTCSNGDTILLNKNEAEQLSYLLEHVVLVDGVDIAVSVNFPK